MPKTSTLAKADDLIARYPALSVCRDDLIEAVKAAGYTNVILRPLMVVAGDHANNDLAGISSSPAATAAAPRMPSTSSVSS